MINPFKSRQPHSDWFASPLGEWLLDNEQQMLRDLIPAGYYPSAMQVGMPHVDMLHSVESGYRVLVRCPATERDGIAPPARVDNGEAVEPGVTRVIAEADALPFGDRTHSLIALPHLLDFCEDPHSVLREINQILIPEGCLVISGFNRLSLWGAGGMWRRGYHRAPWSGRFSRPGQIQDWLSLLGYDVVGARQLAYTPPLQSEKWRRRLGFMEKMGDRWWPGLGSAYIIVGKKREIAKIPGSRRPAWQQFIPAIARPAVQPGRVASRGRASRGSEVAARQHLRLVHSEDH